MAFPVQAPEVSAGPGPGGGFASPAPAVEDNGAMILLRLSQQIVSSARMIAQKVPSTTPEVRQINDLVGQLQMKIKGNQAPPEAQAPPV